MVSAFVYLLVKYSQPAFEFSGSTIFAIQNGTFLILGVTGLLLHSIFRPLERDQFKVTHLIWSAFAFIGIALVQLVTISLTLISISQIDLFFFYGSVALAEEFFFRYGVQNFTEDFFQTKVFKNTRFCNLISTILAITIASLTFGLLHWFVKEDIILVLAVTLSGVVLGIAYRLTKRIDVCLIAHFALNAILVYGGFVA
jgi:membrane protease YdiL (CAAX protease family)